MAQKNYLSASVAVWLKNALCLAGLAMLSHQSVWATDPLYQNFSISAYTVPGNPPPIIDASIFDNENVFSITYSTYSTKTSVPYEFKNTINYTNGDSGVMTFNSPQSTNGFILNLYGVKAVFDDWAPALNNNFMAGSFYNQGSIRVDSLIDGNNVFNFGGIPFYFLTSYGQCVITATNISNPGDIVVGAEGLLQLTGQNVDLTRGVFTMETTLNANQGLGLFGTALLDNVNFSSVGVAGMDTNGDWNPGLYLNATTAQSSFVPLSPFFLYLTNSTAYFDVKGQGTSNVVYRAVFIENNSPQAPYNVYIDAPGTVNLGFEAGAAHVEWVGQTLDPSTGLYTTNYLYLTDNYIHGASTNVAVIGGVPDNFTFLSSTAPLLNNPTAAGFLNVFAKAYITNPYSYMNGQILATSVSTNVSVSNPHGTLTNLPARFTISASQELNLANAIISGQNYLSVTATNQFDGSAGAQIATPYADLNLGVTNGFLTISNLLQANIPNWSGGIQAWSTRWVQVDPNTGVTNDFRVLLVNSQLQPTSVPYVQNLKVHCATNLVISDILNVYSSLSIDAQQITLTTNVIGDGATSLDGELNWTGYGNLGLPQLPNLSCLTNNGAIRSANMANFIGQSNSVSITPGSPAATAYGTLSKVGSVNVLKNSKVVIGTNQYVFVSQLANKIPNQVKLGATLNGSISNLIAAINGAAGAGKTYSTATRSNVFVRAGILAGNSVTVTAAQTGAAANTIPTTTSSPRLTWNGHNTLFGGANAVPAVTNSSSATVPYVAFINNGLVADQGTTLYADNFLSTGVISNGVGNFTARTLTTTLTNGAIYAGGNISLTADTLLTSNLTLQCLSLTLTPTNFIDTGLTNGNFWTVGSSSGTGGQGFALTIKPPTGDMLGTTITNLAPGPNKAILNTWAGTNYGASVQGYSNNMAIGHLVISVQGPTSRMNFTGATGTNNALYVDLLEFTGYLTNGIFNSFEFTNWLNINTNLTIYFAQALMNGASVAEAINTASVTAGKNHGRLLWVPTYAGYYSSVPVVSGGVTNYFNAALAASTHIDSNGNGVYNGSDPSPFFTPDQVNLTIAFTNVPPLSPILTWNTVPSATNCVYYSTNLGTSWLLLTNFVSPVPYLAYPSPAKPVSLIDTNDVGGARVYQVVVYPWLTYPF